MSPEQQVGQLLMVGVTSTGLTSAEAAAVDASRAGSVVLLGNSGRGVRDTASVIDDVRSAARAPRGVGLLVAADQEGGEVQRLRGPGFSSIPSAVAQAELSDAELRRSAAAWGRQLKRAGVDVDLAPVADVVPKALTSTNAPIGRLRRGYGSSPRAVADKVQAFRTGMGRADVGTAVKHFPGLGQVRGNTDFTARVVDRVTTRKDPALAGFRAAIDAQVDMVMVSSAYYAKIDAKRRAAYSPVIIDDLLRGDLGYSGVVISDDLSAVAMRDLPVGERAIRFIRAGGDLAIIGQAGDGPSMTEAVVNRADDDEAFAARVAESAERVVTLKARLGLASC